jgi:PleD family two-component response regulator
MGMKTTWEAFAARPRVLVIEADEGLRTSIRSLLRAHGYFAAAVATPLDALAFFRGGGQVDAVVLDVDADEAEPASPDGTDRHLDAVIRSVPTVVYSACTRTRPYADPVGAAAVVSRLGVALRRRDRRSDTPDPH